MRRARPPARLTPIATLATALTLAAAAAQATPEFSEFWPEIDVYYPIDTRSRVVFMAAATRAAEGDVDSQGLSFQNAQFTLNYDYTLAPILRKDVPEGEWSKNRLLWARLGFDYGTSFTGGPDAYRSYTAVVELSARLPVVEDIWLYDRLRADFRNVNGEPSQRYRFRVGAEWAARLFDHPYYPYGDVEFFYDTRYSQWSRTTFRLGAETPLSTHWRIEPYIALQLNKPEDEVSEVLGFGLAFKYYFP